MPPSLGRGGSTEWRRGGPRRSGSPPTRSWKRRSSTWSGCICTRRRTPWCCADEKSQIQALDRSAPILPLQPGLAERRSHDYVRHGTSTLFAALEIATGQVTAACKPRHRHQEFLAFLRQVTRAYPAGELHLVMDNYAAHKHPNVRSWLAANPRVIVHFTPTHASWMNLVEVWFSIIERQAIHRGTFGSVRDLNAKIRAFIDGWNDRAHPFTWTKNPDQILKKANRKKTSDAAH
jgi:transposase